MSLLYIKMEPNTKRERLQDLWDPEQVRKIFVLGGKEVILELDVMEVTFAYEAYPQIRERFKTEHLWNMIYHEKIVPQLLDLGLEPRKLGDNERQNCLAWVFALKLYSLEQPELFERYEPSRWYCEGTMRNQDITRGVSIRFDKNTMGFALTFKVPVFYAHMRAEIVRELFEETMNNPSFSSEMTFDGLIRTEWEITGAGPAVQQLARVIYTFLRQGFSMVVNWHNRNYKDPPKQFYVREKI